MGSNSGHAKNVLYFFHKSVIFCEVKIKMHATYNEWMLIEIQRQFMKEILEV